MELLDGMKLAAVVMGDMVELRCSLFPELQGVNAESFVAAASALEAKAGAGSAAAAAAGPGGGAVPATGVWQPDKPDNTNDVYM